MFVYFFFVRCRHHNPNIARHFSSDDVYEKTVTSLMRSAAKRYNLIFSLFFLSWTDSDVYCLYIFSLFFTWSTKGLVLLEIYFFLCNEFVPFCRSYFIVLLSSKRQMDSYEYRRISFEYEEDIKHSLIMVLLAGVGYIFPVLSFFFPF